MDWLNDFAPLSHQASDTLPDLMLTHLNSWGVVTLIGNDAKSYLQGQVTCDVVQLDKAHSAFGAQCDAKGKVWSIFRLFHHQGGYALFEPKSAIEKQLAEIKKYAIFSKVYIEQSDAILLGVMGSKSTQFVDELSDEQGDVRTINGGTAVRIDQQRWLLVVEPTAALELVENSSAEKVAESLWRRFDIEAALPIIEQEEQAEHIPQALNLHALHGISFKKGCYTGQETVARAKYRGINKRGMFIVKGHTANELGEQTELERAVGDNWRGAGKLLAHYRFSDGETIGLVILPNNLEPETQLRLTSQPESVWTMQPLPYSLDEQ